MTTSYRYIIDNIEELKDTINTTVKTSFETTFVEEWEKFSKYFGDNSYFKLDTDKFLYDEIGEQYEDNEILQEFTIPSASPYTVRLRQLPVEGSVSVVDDEENPITPDSINLENGVITFSSDDAEKEITVTYWGKGDPLIPLLWNFQDGVGVVVTTPRRIYNYIVDNLIGDDPYTEENPKIVSDFNTMLGSAESTDLETINGKINFLISESLDAIEGSGDDDSPLEIYNYTTDYLIEWAGSGFEYSVFTKDKITENLTIPSESPYGLSLQYKPSKEIAPEIDGYEETIYFRRLSPNRFYIDYVNNAIYFHYTNAGENVTIDYYMSNYKFLTRRVIFEKISDIREKTELGTITATDYQELKTELEYYIGYLDELDTFYTGLNERLTSGITKLETNITQIRNNLNSIKVELKAMETEFRQKLNQIGLFINQFVTRLYDYRNI